MTRTVYRFQAEDISRLSRSLCGQLAEHEGVPGHQSMLNMLARAAGYANYQSWRAARPEASGAASPTPVASPQDTLPATEKRTIERLVRYYDRDGRLAHWPRKRSWQLPCLWLMVEHVPQGALYSEARINALISACHTFGDYALIRHELVMLGALDRTPDGRAYWRTGQAVPLAARILQAALSAQRAH